jgi:ATP-dependent DNA helicase RecG
MKGQQAYVVSPAIDPQDESKVVLRDIQTMELLLRKRFPKATIASVHGKMKSEDMTDRMKRFVSGETHILVATTVIEVGVDVPNATIMVVDHAERFGLSQLHQLRGRIGRGEHAGVFIMISDQESERLKALLALQDGFAIAKKDLELRQSGDFFGTKQSGLPTFIVADASRDVEILTECKRRAEVHVQEGLKAQERLWIRLEHKNFTLAEIS